MSDSNTAAPTSPAAPQSSSSPAQSASPGEVFEANKGRAPSATDLLASKDAPVEGAPETPAEKKARLLKLKVYGNEETYDLDNTPDEVIARDLQLSKAARKIMADRAEEQKRIQEAKALGKKDIAEALKFFDVDDPKAAMEAYLEEFYKGEVNKANMTPEQIELEKFKAEKAAWEAEKAEMKRAKDEAVRAEYQKKAHDTYLQTFSKALESSGLPRTPQTIAAMAQKANFAMDHGLNLTPEQLAAEVKEELMGFQKNVFNGAKGQQLADMLGKDVLNEVRLYLLEQAKLARKTPAPVVQQTAPREEDPDMDGVPVYRRHMFRR